MITGNRVIIKGVTKDSSKEIYKWVNIEELRSLTGTLYPISEYEHDEWIKNATTSSDRKLFLVEDKLTSENIGTIGLKNFDNINRNAELFISLSKYGGFGSDAVATLVNYCFEHLNLHKVYLNVFESNKRAIKCYLKAGFIQEGVLKEHHFNKGNYEDVIVMAVIK